MAVCLFKQASGTKQTNKKPQSKPIIGAKRGNVLTFHHKQEMDFQDFSLSYARGNGVKCKRNYSFVNRFDAE